MSTSTRYRGVVLVAITGVLGVVYAVLAWRQLAQRGEQLRQAHNELAEVREKIRFIQSVQKAPRIASVSIESPAETTTNIDAALQRANLPVAALLRQEPATPRRIERSDFELRQTTIELAPATLPQLAQFAAALRDPDRGSMVSRIRLLAPSPADPETSPQTKPALERWKAEMTLTQVIYSPESSKRGGVGGR